MLRVIVYRSAAVNAVGCSLMNQRHWKLFMAGLVEAIGGATQNESQHMRFDVCGCMLVCVIGCT